MRFHIITLFPHLFDSYFSDSILKRALDKKLISLQFYNPRDYCEDKHLRVDDEAYGGGPGMVMKALPIIRIWEEIQKESFLERISLKKKKKVKSIFFSPAGEKLRTQYVKNIVKESYTDIILINGRYEGIDERVVEITGAEKISIGDYVLTGGELASLVFIDTVARQIPGVLGKRESLEEERVSSHKVYTRPASFRYKGKDYAVPDVLLSGDHKKIDEWRLKN